MIDLRVLNNFNMGVSGLAKIPYINSNGISINSGNLRVSDDVFFTKYNTSIPSYLKINEFDNTFVSTVHSISSLNNLIYSAETTSPSITTTVINPNNRLFNFKAGYEDGDLYQKEFTIDLIDNYIYSSPPLILEKI